MFDPRKRMTIDEAIMHPMFEPIRDMKDFRFEEGKAFDIDLPSDMPMPNIKAEIAKKILDE